MKLKFAPDLVIQVLLIRLIWRFKRIYFEIAQPPVGAIPQTLVSQKTSELPYHSQSPSHSVWALATPETPRV